MRKMILSTVIAAIVSTTTGLFAQNYPTSKIVLSDSPDAPAYALPYTTIKVSITVDKEVVQTGPYARYSQKYLGIMAPLADRTAYTIREVGIDYTDPDRSAAAVCGASGCNIGLGLNADGDTKVSRTVPDRMSSAAKSSEEMARDAANAIFNLRKRRIDLITGEVGENVYGEGLKAAIEEMARLENEYLSLFIGSQTIETEIVEFDVIPQDGKTNYVVCRFTSEQGLLPDSELAAQPVVLTCTPENGVAEKGVTDNRTAKNDRRQVQLVRVADFAECRVAYESEEFAKKRIPVYQFGRTLTLPVSAASK